MTDKYFTKYLKEGEEVKKIVREYVLSHLFAIGIALFFIILPFFLIFPLFQKGFWGVMIFFFVLFFGIGLGSRLAIIWYYNAFMITNERILDFDQKGLFEKTVSESTYDKIQDVSFKMKGFFSTIFGYGTIIIQTAGTNTNLEIKNVYKPEKIQELIMKIQRETTQKNKETKEEMSALELVEILEQAKKKIGKEKLKKFLTARENQEKSDQNSSLRENKQ